MNQIYTITDETATAMYFFGFCTVFIIVVIMGILLFNLPKIEPGPDIQFSVRSWVYEIYFHHPFRLSDGGYFHLPLLSISLGRDGFAVYVLGFSIGMSWHNAEDTSVK